MKSELKIFSGNGNPRLAHAICDYLHLPVGQWRLTRFKDGEIYCQVLENVRGTDVFVIQPTCEPVNENLMELLIAVDGLKRSSAARITAVMPYYGYARQDRKDKPRVPISAKLVADLLQAAGVSRVLTIDLHAPAIQGFFDVPVDHMTAMPMLSDYIGTLGHDEETVIVSPDAGRVKTARNFARKIGTHWAVMEKERPAQQVAEIGYVVGDVKDKTAVLVDDMIDTAGTLTAAATTVLEEGAKRVIACATHGVFSGPAYERIADSDIDQIVVTDTLPQRPDAPEKITVLSTASTLADSIRRIFSDDSVSEIFAGQNQLF
jgi:ribose-phosphate pyrophosphokinase